MSHDLPLDWYEDHDGQSLVLSSEKVAAEIEEQRTIRVGLADQLKGVCDVNASLEKEIERLKEAKRKFSLLCDEKGAENVKLRQENERLLHVEEMAKAVLTTFRKDEAQGYRSRDRQYAIELLGKFIVDEQSTTKEKT